VTLTLHEEHAEIIRRAVSDPKYIGEIDWAYSTIEVVETAEQALLSKTARIVEEVGLRKIGSDYVVTCTTRCAQSVWSDSKATPVKGGYNTQVLKLSCSAHFPNTSINLFSSGFSFLRLLCFWE
jgi:hypothetical protein